MRLRERPFGLRRRCGEAVGSPLAGAGRSASKVGIAGLSASKLAAYGPLRGGGSRQKRKYRCASGSTFAGSQVRCSPSALTV
jgi:hypothetical protein